MVAIVVILKRTRISADDPVMALEALALEAASFSSLTGHALIRSHK